MGKLYIKHNNVWRLIKEDGYSDYFYKDESYVGVPSGKVITNDTVIDPINRDIYFLYSWKSYASAGGINQNISYNLDTKTFTTNTNLTTLHGPVTFFSDEPQGIYIMGGRNSPNGSTGTSTTNNRFNTLTKTYTTLPIGLNVTQRMGTSGMVSTTRVATMYGGTTNGNNTTVATVRVAYNITTNTWSVITWSELKNLYYTAKMPCASALNTQTNQFDSAICYFSRNGYPCYTTLHISGAVNNITTANGFNPINAQEIFVKNDGSGNILIYVASNGIYTNYDGTYKIYPIPLLSDATGTQKAIGFDYKNDLIYFFDTNGSNLYIYDLKNVPDSVKISMS